jgi:hypothetical protein
MSKQNSTIVCSYCDKTPPGGALNFLRDVIILLVESDEKSAARTIILQTTGKKSQARKAIYKALPENIRVQLDLPPKEVPHG